MANAVIKHFRRYEYLISNDVITLAKTKVEITSAFSSSLRISINRKKMTSARVLEMCQKSIDFRVLSIIGTPLIMISILKISTASLDIIFTCIQIWYITWRHAHMVSLQI